MWRRGRIVGGVWRAGEELKEQRSEGEADEEGGEVAEALVRRVMAAKMARCRSRRRFGRWRRRVGFFGAGGWRGVGVRRGVLGKAGRRRERGAGRR